MKEMKHAAGIFAAGVCLLSGMAVRADEWPEAKVRALDRRALEAVADLALVPPPLNTSPGPEYGAAKERWAMNNGAALTPKGRLWASWIGGGDSPDAYTVCAFSDDNGETWNPPALVVDGHDPKHLPFPRSNIIANLWTDPAGRLRLFVSQSMWHNDGRMGVWETVCANPDDAKPAWSPIRRICDGAALNKPIVLRNGTWLLPVELPRTWGMWSGLFGTSDKDAGAIAVASEDGGKTWTRRGGVVVPKSTWPEPHFLELKDGTIRMYMRSGPGLRVAESRDEGRTWGAVTKPAGMDQPSARCQVRALASGNWIFVKHLSPPDSYNDNKRIGLIAYLSRDEGRTWEGGLVLDARKSVSYPDVEQGPDGTIYVTHDFERGREAEIILHKFTEADILAKKFQSPQSRRGVVVMKAMGTEHNMGKQNQSGLAVAETVGLWKGAPVPRAAELERLEGVEFSVIKKHEPEADGYEWLHGVALCWHKGRLWASYGTNRGKENTPTEEAHVRVSDDGGKTWGAVQVVAKGGNGQGFSHGALASHDGVLWCFAAAISNKCANTQTYAFTLDEAHGSWMPRGAVVRDGFWPMQGPVKMANGNWLMGGLHVGAKGCGDRSRPAVAISHGEDFTRWDVSIVNEGEVPRCWGEATADVRGSCVTLTMRPGWGAEPSLAYVATSVDYGRTWTPLRATNLPLATSKPFTGILSTGQRYVVSQTTADGGRRRHPLTIAVSRPGEWAYSRVYLIRPAVFAEGPGESHPKASLAYPYAVERDGKLYVAYSNSGGRGGNRNSAELAVIPVASLGCGSPAADAAIDIDTGRQLFVDDYLVESTAGVVRHWNKPVKMENPVVWPKGGAAPKKTDGSAKTKKGDEAVNLTCATDGGLWWDPTRRKFRLWYQADWLGDICYAESADGVKWEYPDLGVVPGTNRIFEYDKIDSWSVTPNYAAANPYADWKLHISAPGMWTTDTIYSSSDGIHFDELGVAGMSGDRSTSYYDPFRGVWVFSLRDGRPKVGRSRCYFASKEFGGDNCHWSWPKCTSQAESLGKFAPPEEWLVATNGLRRSLYSFNAVAYESLMLGVMEILYNTPGDNADCEKAGLPKQTALHFTFSRDGKTYEPRKDADIAPEGWGSGKWDSGYLSAIGGICVVKDEKLWFYYSGLRGDATRRGRDFGGWYRNGMYSNGSIGVATLRRDGFAGMVADGMGEIVTKPVVFGGSRLFVNAESRFGYVEAEVLDVGGNPIPGYTRDDCAAFWHGDSTKRELVFRGRDLAALAGREVRFRFLLKCATLYSFWVSPTALGESRGYVAGGGPAYRGLRDMPPADILKARTFPADYVKKPDPKAHAVNARAGTLVSSMAVAPNGRLWATWYCGITPAEDQNNYVVLSTSADDGRTWREVFVADPDGAGMERPFDPEVWVAPDGSLRWIWADRICRDLCGRKDDAYPDILMMSTIPDANVVPAEPPQPRPIAEGVMMCKPTVLKDGTWAFPAAMWGGKPWSSCLYASTDGGKTFVLRGGAKVPQEDTEFDEHMFVERKNGDLVCYSRAKSGIRETVSKDGGFSWGSCVKSKLPHPSARCFVRKLKSGAWLLVKHGGLGEAKRRSHLTAYVSDDEGATWKGGLLLEERWGCSYPDGQETADGTIYITYDWDRYNDRTIYFCTFTEEDVRAGKAVSGKVRLRQVVSQGRGRPIVAPQYIGAPRKDHFWNLRKWRGSEVQISTPGGRLWKTWCADAKHDFDSHDAYAILATSTDGGKKWKEVLVVDPDDFWPRRPENARLALEDGKLVWSWVDRISWNKDGAEQKWRLVLDAEKEPSPDAAFKAELVTGE